MSHSVDEKDVDRLSTAFVQLQGKQESEDDDTRLGVRVSEVVDERDRALFVAREMLSTLLLERNKEFVSPELRTLAETTWKRQVLALDERRELTDEDVDYAIAASGINVQNAYDRVKALIAKHAAQPKAGEGEEV